MGEVEVDKTLFEQVEDELGATPGAYCSRKVAVRAMELLREVGQKEFSEVDERIAAHLKTIDQYANRCVEQTRVIERQTQAIRRLEEEKTRRGQLSQHRDIPMGPGIMEQMKRNSSVFDYNQQMRKTLNIKLDDNGPWKQF